MQVLKEKKYFENLDALRAIAALSVVCYHCVHWLRFPTGKSWEIFKNIFCFNEQAGPLSVRFFFVLSGFLITYLMFDERINTGKFNIRNFYLRRILRIFPIYYILLIIGFVIYPTLLFLREVPYTEVSNPFRYIFFISNFDAMYFNFPKNGLLGVQWSVSVEEQFYLLAPLLFLAASPKYFPLLQICLIIFSWVFYILHINESSAIQQYHTISVLNYLSVGSLMAWVSFYHLDRVKIYFKKIPKTFHLIIYFTFLLLVFYLPEMKNFSPAIISISQKILFTLFSVFIILEQNFSSNSFFKAEKFRLLTHLGKISYGIYIYHMVAIYLVIWIFDLSPDSVLIQILSTILLTIIFSELSFRFIEKRISKLKSKLLQ